MAGKLPMPQLEAFWTHPGEQPPKWESWKRRFDNIVALINREREAANRLSDGCKNQLLYGYLGAEGVRRFETHPTTSKQLTTSHDAYVNAVKDCLGEKTLPALAFHQFRTCKQEADETTTSYISHLRALQADCDYTDFNTDKDLAFVLAQNCFNKESQKKLLSTTPIKLDTFINILQTDEIAAASAIAIRADGGQGRKTVQNIQQNKPWKQKRRQGKENDLRRPQGQETCARCGYKKHKDGEKCPAEGAECYNCGKKNHLAKVCRSAKKDGSAHQQNEVKAENTASQWRVAIKSTTLKKRYPFTLNVLDAHGKPHAIEMAVDSGADVNVMTKKLYDEHFASCKLQKSHLRMTNFDNSELKGIAGRFSAEVQHKNDRFMTDFYVSTRDVTPVLGADLIGKMKLIIDGATGQVQSVTYTEPKREVAATSATIEKKYPSLALPTIGKVPGVKHKITLKNDAIPVAAKLRPVAIAYRQAVNDEVEEMAKQGIWEKVEGPSAWVHGLVAVTKPNGV